jgi:hypothetical protein
MDDGLFSSVSHKEKSTILVIRRFSGSRIERELVSRAVELALDVSLGTSQSSPVERFPLERNDRFTPSREEGASR